MTGLVTNEPCPLRLSRAYILYLYLQLDVNKIIEPDGSSKGKPSTELGVIKKTDRIDSLTVREFPPLIKNLLNHVKQLGLGFCCRSRARICRSDMFQLQQTNFPVRFQLCQN